MVGFTVVMEKDDPLNQRLPNYEYLVCADKSVIELDPSLFTGFKHGTRITHISYDFQGWTGPFTTAAWQIFHQALFDPVLPFKVSGTRAKEAKLGSRIVIGNAARLSHVDAVKDIELAHFDAVKYELGPEWGSVIFNYWALERPADSGSASDVAASYVQAGTAVSMTLFGQRQDAEPRSWIREQAKLPFLYKNMVIQIDADGLSPIAKRELFASTRERATSSEIRSVIYKGLASTLLADEMLRRLDYEAKERALAKSTAATNEKVQRRLARFVKTKLKDKFKPGSGGTSGNGDGRTKPPPGPKPEPRNIDDSHLKSSPTILRFDPSSRRVHQGSRTTVWVEVDAKNNFLPENDSLLTIVWANPPGDKVRLVSRSKLLGGRSRWAFEVAEDAPLETFTLTATLGTPNGPVSDSLQLTVLPPRKGEPQNQGKEEESGPKVTWVDRSGWSIHGFDARSVGRVTEDADETIIFINRHFAPLDQALAGRRHTEEAINVRADRYQFPVACGLWLQDHEAKKTANRPDESYLQGEMRRLAEAVLVAIDPDVDIAIEESDM